MTDQLVKNEITGDKKLTIQRTSRPRIKHLIDVKQTIFPSSAQRKQLDNVEKPRDKSVPLRACGCAFKFVPSQGKPLSPKTKATSKSDDKLSNRLKLRSKSCTPPHNEKFTLTQNKTRGHADTIVRFSSENALNKEKVKEQSEEDDKLILVPEVYGEHRFQTTFWWEPRALPYKYSTSVYIDLNSTAKYYVEEVSMKVRLVPCPYVESLGTLQRYKSTVEADIQPSTVMETTFHLSEKYYNETII